MALFGAARAGLPFVPLNYRLADEQLADVASRHELVVVAGGAEATRLRTLGLSRLVDPADLLVTTAGESEAPPVVVDPDEVALLLYTSGTTSAPKAAVLRHRHLTAYVIGTVEFASMPADDAVLVSVPPYHVAGVMNLLTNLYSGRRIVYLANFDAATWLQVARDERVTHAMVVPTMLARINQALGEGPAELPALRSLAYGGAPMPEAVITRALELLPDVAFTNAYGLTETSSTITVLGPEDHRRAATDDDPAVRARLRSAGQALPGIELEVRDPLGAPCDPGRSGTSTCGASRWPASTSARPRPTTGGSPPATGARSTRRATSSSRAGPTTPSSGAARTSRRPRWRTSCCGTRRSPSARWSDARRGVGPADRRRGGARAGAAATPEALRDFARSHLRPPRRPR